MIERLTENDLYYSENGREINTQQALDRVRKKQNELIDAHNAKEPEYCECGQKWVNHNPRKCNKTTAYEGKPLKPTNEVGVEEIENNIADSLDKEIPWLREDLLKFAKDIVTTLLTTYHITKREGK